MAIETKLWGLWRCPLAPTKCCFASDNGGFVHAGFPLILLPNFYRLPLPNRRFFNNELSREIIITIRDFITEELLAFYHSEQIIMLSMHTAVMEAKK